MEGQQKLFQFKSESVKDDAEALPCWKILTVEDDPQYQMTLIHGLKELCVFGRRLEVLTAASAAMAVNSLKKHSDICLVFLDVVMETDDAGLKLIDFIREELENSSVRIVLLTGQPGMAPRMDAMSQYDINEYWNKTDLTMDKLYSITAGNVRSWQAIDYLERSRKSMQTFIDASRRLSSETSLKSYCDAIVREIAAMSEDEVEGTAFVCISSNEISESKIVSASGEFLACEGQPFSLLAGEHYDDAVDFKELLLRAVLDESHQFGERITVLFFGSHLVGGSNYCLILKVPGQKNSHFSDLIKIFCENLSNGFSKVVLLNRLSCLAYQDSELPVPNRNWMINKLNTMAEEERSDCVLIVFEVKNLNALELSNGNDFCKKLLVAIAKDLKNKFSSCLSFARIDDDLFALMFHQDMVPSPRELADTREINVYVTGMRRHVQLTLIRLQLSALAGQPAEMILSYIRATIKAGEDSERPFRVFSQDLMKRIVLKQKIILDIERALKKDEFFLVFQPKVHLEDGSIFGFEALVRWRKPDGGLVSSDQFIPIAEESGLIGRLDQKVFDMTLQAAQKLIDAGFSLPISFNATCQDLVDQNYISGLSESYSRSGIPASLLEIEITESQAMGDYERVNPILKNLISLGFSVSIDDFGTGYSSLSHVTRLAATSLKIDRSFVTAMTQNEAQEHVADMVLQLGKKFNFRVVAEGIETEEQRQMLLEKGCKLGQGYLFAKPMEFEKLLEWIKSR